MEQLPEATRRAIEAHFHALLRKRAAKLIDQHGLRLPQVVEPLPTEVSKEWFPIRGMAGGFNYWFDGEGQGTRLVCESWCRVVEGSGQRHEITAAGCTLVAEGFV